MAEKRYTNKEGLQHAIDKIRSEIPYGILHWKQIMTEIYMQRLRTMGRLFRLR